MKASGRYHDGVREGPRYGAGISLHDDRSIPGAVLSWKTVDQTSLPPPHLLRSREREVNPSAILIRPTLFVDVTSTGLLPFQSPWLADRASSSPSSGSGRQEIALDSRLCYVAPFYTPKYGEDKTWGHLLARVSSPSQPSFRRGNSVQRANRNPPEFTIPSTSLPTAAVSSLLIVTTFTFTVAR